MTSTMKQLGAMRIVSYGVLVVAVVAGDVRDLWWLWIVYWLMSDAFSLVTDRLVYWQRRYIDSLKESSPLDECSHYWWSDGDLRDDATCARGCGLRYGTWKAKPSGRSES